MYTQISSVLFSEREDTVWDSSTLFPGESRNHSASDPAPIHAFNDTNYPLLLTNPMTHKSLDDLSLVLNTPAPLASPPPPELAPMSWRTAAQESVEGVHYVKERFPSEHVSYLSPPFRKEPIQVEANERVVLLDEVSEYIVRVRKLNDGRVGVVPVWDIEDPLERLARMNMEFNEIVTSPPPQSFRRTLATAFPNQTFMHTAPDDETPGLQPAGSDGALSSPEMGSDDDLPVTPTTPAAAPRKVAVRKVEFAPALRKTIFRYPRPEHVAAAVEGEEWWWDGWEESEGGVGEESEPQADDNAAISADERLGRPRIRRRQDAFLA